MKIIKNLAGIVCVLLGGLWVLQGANIVAGSAMSGQNQWLIIGAIVVIVGLGLLYWTNGRPNRLP